MLDHDTQPDVAEAVFRRKLRQKLSARGYQGTELDRRVERLIHAPVRFRLDRGEEAAARDQPDLATACIRVSRRVR